ncbi:DUF2867 domain-containing protein [Streptomyces anulatus]|uniref:DUF2867 domain-containing protein n=1 Tax=Streptomyces anulatus TaxID=1892 RepID=UPI0035DD3E22
MRWSSPTSPVWWSRASPNDAVLPTLLTVVRPGSRVWVWVPVPVLVCLPVRSWSALSGPGQPCPGSSGRGRPACRAHIGRVPDRAGGCHGRLAVLVKPNGRLGSLYMLGIKPFRYLGVYPALLRSIGREWQENAERRAAA